ncbi:MAG: homoserine O-acetyltransferase [Chitinophagia bacterium]
MDPIIYTYHQPFTLESGTFLPKLKIAYHYYGEYTPGKKVAWICHALTANSDAADWWKGFVGEDAIIHPNDYFIVCANIIGSCYGSTGPTTMLDQFPLITIRDMVRAHILLRQHLGIDTIDLLLGGSMGGYQALEWSLMEPTVIQKMFLLATSASESAWGIAIHTAQRLAIEADSTWKDATPNAGAKGLKAARAIGILTYRNYTIFKEKQTDADPEKIDDLKASSYINYQGDKLVNRFNAYSYWLLTKAMDSHHLARGRGGDLMATLASIQTPTLIIGIQSDLLCPLQEQQWMANHMPNATLVAIDSNYGHDGFIIETKTITTHLKTWLHSLI